MNEADRVLLERIVREGHVDTRVEPASWGEWLRDVVVALANWLTARVGDSLPGLPVGLAAAIGWALLALLAASIALLVLRSLRAPVAARRRGASVVALPAPPPVTAPADWRSEAARRLAAGDVEAALAAAWWWFATSICSAPVDPAWTTREVLERSRRHDLDTLGRELDSWIYGSRRPGAQDVAALLRAIEGARARA